MKSTVFQSLHAIMPAIFAPPSRRAPCMNWDIVKSWCGIADDTDVVLVKLPREKIAHWCTQCQDYKAAAAAHQVTASIATCKHVFSPCNECATAYQNVRGAGIIVSADNKETFKSNESWFVKR